MCDCTILLQNVFYVKSNEEICVQINKYIEYVICIKSIMSIYY